jgi:hypothetical protein
MKRKDHVFLYSGDTIAKRLEELRTHHLERIVFWQKEETQLRLQEGAGVKESRGHGAGKAVVLSQMQSKIADAVANQKKHTDLAASLLDSIEMYGSQGAKVYELDVTDIKDLGLTSNAMENLKID